MQSFFVGNILFSKFFIICFDAVCDYLLCFLAGEKLLYCGLLVFKLLIDSKEVHYFIEDVTGKLVYGLDVIISRIGEGNGDYFVVKSSVVYHSHNSYGVHSNEGHRENLLFTDNKNVKGVSVVCVGAGNESVVCGIVGRGVEHSVKTKQTCVLVKLIFTATSLGDLNYADEIFRGYSLGGDIVPDV